MADFIDFPIFTGVSGDLKHWILWLEEFFVRERFTAMEKMNLAQSLLAGEAESWFYSLKRSIFRSWEHLIDVMIWWFGDCNEFGDFIDPELFRLWDKNARILQARRVEKKRKRRKATSIQEKVTIWDTETEALIPMDTIPVVNWTESRESSSAQELIEKDESHEATLVKVLDNLEEASVTQNQVPVSSLEPSLSFSSEPLDVSASWPCAIVSNNPVHSQSVLDCVTSKTNAYQVFDKTSSYTESLKPKTKRKLRLSLKTWRFKFKHTSKKRKSLDVKFFPVEEIVAGCEKKLFDRFQTSPSYALDVVNETSKPWETHTPFTSTPVASVNSLSFTVDNFELCVGHDKDIMRLKLLLHSGCDGEKLPELDFHFGVNHGLLVFPWNLMLLEFFLFYHLEDKVCLSAASNSYYGWMVFDRGKNIKISGDVITRVFLDLKKFLCEKVHRVSFLSLAAQFNTLEIIQDVLEQILQGDDEDSTKVIDKLQIQLKQGMNLHGASWHCSSDEMNQFLSPIRLVDALYSGLGENDHALLAAEVHESGQQQSSSIWHRWRRKDCTRISSCVLPLQFSFFKLEDKLVLREESIDTIQGLVMTWQEAQIQVKTRMGIEGLPFQAIVVREAP